MWFKQVSISILAIGFLWSIAPVTRSSPTPVSHPITTPRVIRFRVIANSDNPFDQAIKLEVRDAVLRVLEPQLEQAHSVLQAKNILSQDKNQLQVVANQVLSRAHAPYHAQVTLGTTVFPTKAYGSWILPAGHYTALLVRLGKAKGHNWWCVLYPSLCFVDMGNAVAIPYQTTVSEQIAPTVSQPSVASSMTTGKIHVSWQSPRLLRDFLNWL